MPGFDNGQAKAFSIGSKNQRIGVGIHLLQTVIIQTLVPMQACTECGMLPELVNKALIEPAFHSHEFQFYIPVLMPEFFKSFQDNTMALTDFQDANNNEHEIGGLLRRMVHMF